MTHVIEIPVCFLIFGWFWILRIIPFISFISLNLMINITGNFGHLGIMTIVECIPIMDDWTYQFLFELQPDQSWLYTTPYSADVGWFQPLWSTSSTSSMLYYGDISLKIFLYALSYLIFWLYSSISMVTMLEMIIHYYTRINMKNNVDYTPSAVVRFFRSTLVIPPLLRNLSDTLRSWNIMNKYSKFANITKIRWELIVEGSNDLKHWQQYEYKHKPSSITKKPSIIPGYMPSLDWRLWFIPLDIARRMGRDNPDYRAINPNNSSSSSSTSSTALFSSPSDVVSVHQVQRVAMLPQNILPGWYINFIDRLYSGKKEVLNLLQSTPFPDKPPQYLRTAIYSYYYSSPSSSSSSSPSRSTPWWERELIGYINHFVVERSEDSSSDSSEEET
eukprot:TRINITY_DN6059_c0_g1_i1.p1 TRINITY_DN6059_c0_g1~~TRINITY_DN6059_c0_g1_i1.p1  ORF type:complete len:389 (+),score=81.19 TRINITY_DN6059_c0_g1_i1:83-1249(+)